MKTFFRTSLLGFISLSLALSACDRKPPFPTNSYELSSGADLDGHTLDAIEILGRQSLAFLEVTSLSGDVKFLPNTPFEPVARPVAYRVELTAAPYSEAATNVYTSPNAFVSPNSVTNGLYGVAFNFRLKDKDGFILAELKSEGAMQDTLVTAGKTQTFRGVTTNAVSPYVASATASVEGSVTVLRGTAMTVDADN
jgi:hypothetical protein